MAKRPNGSTTSENGSATRLTVRLDHEQAAQLARIAERRGTTTDSMAGAWLQAMTELVGLSHHVDPRDHGTLEARVTEQAGELAAHEERLSRLERLLAAGLFPQGAGGLEDVGRRAPGLHEEIVSVLREKGGPMSARDIAVSVRHRGLYQAPRSQKPVTGAMISSRVSNPFYRELFRRENRKISLADES
jgi:hypothetical protein